MMDYRRLHDEITEVVAQGLHYSENMEKINAMHTAADVVAATECGVDRYMKDPIYHAKVQSLVARLMRVIEKNNDLVFSEADAQSAAAKVRTDQGWMRSQLGG